jgi:ubiquinol-cytochrome c reductase cytochrome c1 subunit
VPDIGDDGSAIERPGRPSDRFRKPFANDLAAAAANGGKAPPELSVIVKAREHGPDYIHALLTGYVPFEKLKPEQIKEFAVTKDDNFNTYFPGHRIAMPPPLSDGKVTYADGTKNTLDQEVKDVIEFLAWASEPHLEDRNRTGVRVILFLLAMAGLMYAVKRAVWSDVAH